MTVIWEQLKIMQERTLSNNAEERIPALSSDLIKSTGIVAMKDWLIWLERLDLNVSIMPGCSID